MRWRSCRPGELPVHPGGSDCSGELAESGCDAKTAVPGFESEFIVAAPQVMEEGMPSDVLADRNVFRPRVGCRRALSLPWSHFIRLFACCSVT